MNLRAPYSPPAPARKARELKRTAHFRHDNTHPQILWNHRLARAGDSMVVDGMTVAQTPWLASSGLLQVIFYVVAGIGWVLPAMPIISWMARPDAQVTRREFSAPEET